MTSIGKPTGLIRYTSREVLAGGTTHLLRPRTIIYPAALALVIGILVWQLDTMPTADVTLLRSLDRPFTEESDGRIANQVRIKIANRSNGDRQYQLTVSGVDEGQVVIPVNPFPVAEGANATTSIFVLLPRESFHDGDRMITVRVSDGDDFTVDYPYRLLGPRGASAPDTTTAGNATTDRTEAK